MESSWWNIANSVKDRGKGVTHIFNEKGEFPVKLLANIRNSSTGESKQVCVTKMITVGSDAAGKNKPAKKGFKIVKGMEGIENDGNISIQKRYSAEDELARKAVFQVQVMSSEKKLRPDDRAFDRIVPQYTVRVISRPEEKSYSYIIAEEAGLMAAYPAFRAAVSAGFGNTIIRTRIPSAGEGEVWNLKRAHGTSTDTYFVNNGTVISTAGIPALDQLVLILRRNPEMKIRIECHTDNMDHSPFTLQLTMKRAAAILEYIAGKGISRSRLAAAGYGGTRPVAPDYPESERKKNRRIDFVSFD